jgi:hypothetical protein
MKLADIENDYYLNWDKMKQSKGSKTPVVLQNYSISTSMLTKEDGTDVFDSPVPQSHIEKELQKGNKENFIFTFCNYKYHEVKMYIELDGEKEEFLRTQDSKYCNRPKTETGETAGTNTKFAFFMS